MKYELRGIILSYPNGRERINLLTREPDGTNYQRFEYPEGERLSITTITTYLAKCLSCDPADISIPKHIKIPQEEPK